MIRKAPWLLVCAAPLGVVLPACTFIVDKEADQCSVPQDCSKFPGTACVENVCQPATIAGSCQTNDECIGALGANHICRKSDRTCRPLLSSLCTTIEGDYTDDGAFIIGSVLPVTGDAQSTGIPEENGIKLAINDFEITSNGLPGSSPRPIVLVGCTDDADKATAVKAATHLVGTVGVPAIIGAAFSGITIEMTTSVTTPNDVLVISPSATATAITDQADKGLLWRTSPSDVFQGVALAQFIEKRIEPRLRSELMLMPSDKIKLSVLYKSDAYGSGLAEALEGEPGNVKINGEAVTAQNNMGFYQRVDYGDPDDPMANPPKYQDAIEAAYAKKPHIIAIFGTTEAVVDVMIPIENGWDTNGPAVSHRPMYLFGDGGYIKELEKIANEDWRKRVSGSVPGTTNPVFNAFRNAYNAKFADAAYGPDTFGAAGAYDATYLLAYAAVANASKPETGPNLAAALKLMVGPGDVIDAGRSKINTAFNKLSAGAKIDFNGASGPLAFDTATGEAPSDVQIWCVTRDNDNAILGSFSDIYLDAASLSLAGPSWFSAFCQP